MFVVIYSSELDTCVRRKFFDTREEAVEWIENFYQTCFNYPCSGDATLVDENPLFWYPQDIE